MIDLNNRPLSYSSIKEFARSPRHYLEYITKPRFAPTDAMKLGSMVHCLLLQPSEFDNQFLVAPEINKRTNAGKEEWANLLAANEDKQIVSSDDYATAICIVNNANKNKSIRASIRDCYLFEEEWHNSVSDLPYRGFFDGVANDYILEIKTTNDANPKSVMADFYKRKYHIQAGLYNLASLKRIKYLIIETSYPYLSYTAFADDLFVNKGISEVSYLNSEFKKCLEANDFSYGYEYFYKDDITISLPSWSVDK